MTRSTLARLAAPVLLLALLLAPAACSDDDDPGPGAEAGTPGKEASVGGDGALPWPDTRVYKDSKPASCSPGAANMCGGNKNFYCKAGVCTPCPANYVDCDRKDKCECFGACDGNKCVKGGG